MCMLCSCTFSCCYDYAYCCNNYWYAWWVPLLLLGYYACIVCDCMSCHRTCAALVFLVCLSIGAGCGGYGYRRYIVHHTYHQPATIVTTTANTSKFTEEIDKLWLSLHCAALWPPASYQPQPGYGSAAPPPYKWTTPSYIDKNIHTPSCTTLIFYSLTAAHAHTVVPLVNTWLSSEGLHSQLKHMWLCVYMYCPITPPPLLPFPLVNIFLFGLIQLAVQTSVWELYSLFVA